MQNVDNPFDTDLFTTVIDHAKKILRTEAQDKNRNLHIAYCGGPYKSGYLFNFLWAYCPQMTDADIFCAVL